MRRWWWLLLLLVILAIWFAFCRNDPRPGGGAATRLELESIGAFQYVPTRADNVLEIAYLDSVNAPPCVINQLGTELFVEIGNIVEVQVDGAPGPIPANKKFDLDRAVVTFPDLEAANQTLTAPEVTRPANPNQPADPANDAHWDGLQWIASTEVAIRNGALSPNWRTKVNGRIVLEGGTLRARHPSDVHARHSLFEFKQLKDIPNPRPPMVQPFTQAITDRTMYVVDVPSNRIVMNLSEATSKVTRIVVEPLNPGQGVKLRLLGRHTHATPVDLQVGAPVMDFCPFYQLLEPVPDPQDWLIPHYLGRQGGPATQGGLATGGQPQPGPFCPSNWGPE